MVAVNLTKVSDEGVCVWYTENIALYRQLAEWYATTRVHQFVVGTAFGFVVVTRPGAILGAPSLRAWAIFRPCSLVTTWSDCAKVEWRLISLHEGVDWYNSEGRAWVHVKAQPVITQQCE